MNKSTAATPWLVFAGLLVVVLTGCATGDSGTAALSDPSAASAQWKKIPADHSQSVVVKYFGFVDVTQDEDGESQYFEAGFAQFVESAPLSVLLESFRQFEPDSCDYHQQAPGDSTPLDIKDDMELPGYPYEFVGAGNRIDVSRGSRRYASLKRTTSDAAEAVQYETDVGSLPLSFGGLKLGDAWLKTTGLRLSSSGDVFPAFAGIEVPAIDAVNRYKPGVGTALKSDSVISWRKGRFAHDPAVRFQIEAGGGGRAVFCALTDDGKFQFPDDVKSQLGDARIPNSSAFRDAVWFYLHQDALLIISQSSYY